MPFSQPGAGITGTRVKVVFAGEGEEARLEAHQTAIVFGDGGQQIVVPTFTGHSAQGLKGVLVATREGFKTLAVGELDIEHAAVGLDQAEGVELALIALIVERVKVAPVDLEALAGRGFHAHEGTRGRAGGTHAPQVAVQDGVPAGITGRAQALQDDDSRGVRVLFQQFGDERLESIELAGARTMHRQGHGCRQILFNRARGQVELAGDAARRPMLAARETMNFVDLITLEHACGYKLTPGARPEGCSLQAARGRPARKASRLKNQELGIGQVVLYKIVGGRAQQPNLGGRTL